LKIDIPFLNIHKNICVACSGGADSMVLCQLLLNQNIKFSIAHCNFQLRGNDSDMDAQFVKSFARNHQIPFFCRSFDTKQFAKENKTSIEIEARNLRYHFFQELSQEHKMDLFLIAHHKDDNVETILMRMISGTGLQGLSGIPTFRAPNYYRPLLSFSKNEILEYAFQNNIEFREDQSNFENEYTRNKIRNNIMPQIETINPAYRESISQIAQISYEVNELLADKFSELKTAFKINETLSLENFHKKKYLGILLHYILSDFNPNRAEIQQISLALFLKESKKCQCGSDFIEVKNGVLTQIVEVDNSEIIFKNLSELYLSTELLVEEATSNFEYGVVYFDIDKLNFPLKHRAAKNGDKIKPIGMKGMSKKLSDIFQEKKWTLNQKNSKSVIEDALGEIIGIVGVTSSLSTLVDDSTRHIIKITIKINT